VDRASEAVVIDAISIVSDHGKLKTTEVPSLIKKVKDNKLTDDDIEFLLTIFKICLRHYYNEMIKIEEGTEKTLKYGITAKKLAIETLNKAIDAIKKKSENKAKSGLYGAIPVLVAPAVSGGGDGTGWLVVVLGIVSIAMLVYSIYVVKKVKKKLKRETAE